jgi:hypothetical protein
VIVCVDEIGPEAAKSCAGQALVHQPAERAKQEVDYGRRGKGMFRAEPAVADGGTLVVCAPHIDEVSDTHGALLTGSVIMCAIIPWLIRPSSRMSVPW